MTNNILYKPKVERVAPTEVNKPQKSMRDQKCSKVIGECRSSVLKKEGSRLSLSGALWKGHAAPEGWTDTPLTLETVQRAPLLLGCSHCHRGRGGAERNRLGTWLSGLFSSPLSTWCISRRAQPACAKLPAVWRPGNPPAGEPTHLGMDALKSAGRAIIKSPGVPRHTWGTSKHEKLPENWTDTKETLLEGMVFNVKYLGMTLVGQPKGEDMASAAIRRIVATARASAKKFRKVTLTVSPKGIIITDTETTDLIENVSIYRISYCTADKTQDKVFAYVSQSQFNETLECHAFLCQKRKIAQAVTLTVAQAFKVALDLWEIAQEDKSKKARTCSCAASNGQTHSTDTQCVPAELESHTPVGMEERHRRPLFSASLSSPSPRSNPTRRWPIKHDSWDAEDGFDDAFPSNMEVEEMDTGVAAASHVPPSNPVLCILLSHAN
ncbi:low density lipoprotein receptor adapter protein 1 isoform X3 [Channa argus]|uniref:low density lipoprotein receptor adapter protein 1 isoform X3 n=1 Tax=Channa argus TaxID=215402 RepID=UPI0035213EFF